jgi:predicted DsbA family dithiol-disulfide isomerase
MRQEHAMSTGTSPLKIDIWSDVACPWCYLGKRRLESALESFARRPEAPPVEIEYHSYQLNPDLPPDFEGGHSEYLQSRLGMSQAQIAASNRNLAHMGETVGAEYHMDRVVISNTAKANELLHFAKARGKQAEMKERLFQAYWAEGRRLGHVNELVELAGEVGLDRAAARRALEAGECRGAVRDDMEQAQRYGIQGVPFFVLDGKYGLSGAREPETFLQALEALARERRGAA